MAIFLTAVQIVVPHLEAPASQSYQEENFFMLRMLSSGHLPQHQPLNKLKSWKLLVNFFINKIHLSLLESILKVVQLERGEITRLYQTL
mmetsp:Transcript_196/g.273  ORF Transcript_196/g.273 Transcript_196/m.273 type:complete len:89 (-) Transcript_196:20-286(-)